MTEPRFFRSDGCFGLTLALRALRGARTGPADDSDRPRADIEAEVRSLALDALRCELNTPNTQREGDKGTAGEIATSAGPAGASNVAPIGAARRR